MVNNTNIVHEQQASNNPETFVSIIHVHIQQSISNLQQNQNQVQSNGKSFVSFMINLLFVDVQLVIHFNNLCLFSSIPLLHFNYRLSFAYYFCLLLMSTLLCHKFLTNTFTIARGPDALYADDSFVTITGSSQNERRWLITLQ